jgi:hypothetical protein
LHTHSTIKEKKKKNTAKKLRVRVLFRHCDMQSSYKKPGSGKKRWRARFLICVNQEREREGEKKITTFKTDNLFLWHILKKKRLVTWFVKKNNNYFSDKWNKNKILSVEGENVSWRLLILR